MVDGRALEVLMQIKRGIDVLRNETCCNLRTANEMAEGGTPYTYTTANTTNATSVKSGATSFTGLTATNTSGTAFYVKIYNKGTAPVVGTDVPVVTYLIPANSSASFQTNIKLSAGLAFATTALAATSDTTVVSAGSIVTLVD